MNAEVYRFIEALHGAPTKVVLAITGGGASAAAMLLSVPGASKTLLEVHIPYDGRSLTEFLGHEPTQSCSAATSQALADRCHARAMWLAPTEGCIGVGCTASLATDRPKKGEHRFHLTVRDAATATTWSLTLRKDARTRQGEEHLLDRVLLNALADFQGQADRLPLALFPEEVLERHSSALDPLRALREGTVPALLREPDGRLVAGPRLPRALLPGSFNPIHEGHLALARLVARQRGFPVDLELSVANVDKPTLSLTEIRKRLAPIGWQASVWITRAATFRAKAELFPGALFVVGADTAERIVAPRYYGGDPSHMSQALEVIRQRGCRFLVAGRRVASGAFVGLADLAIPEALRDLFEAIPASEFSVPLSSTTIRQRSATPIALEDERA